MAGVCESQTQTLIIEPPEVADQTQDRLDLVTHHCRLEMRLQHDQHHAHTETYATAFNHRLSCNTLSMPERWHRTPEHVPEFATTKGTVQAAALAQY